MEIRDRQLWGGRSRARLGLDWILWRNIDGHLEEMGTTKQESTRQSRKVPGSLRSESGHCARTNGMDIGIVRTTQRISQEDERTGDHARALCAYNVWASTFPRTTPDSRCSRYAHSGGSRCESAVSVLASTPQTGVSGATICCSFTTGSLHAGSVSMMVLTYCVISATSTASMPVHQGTFHPQIYLLYSCSSCSFEHVSHILRCTRRFGQMLLLIVISDFI